MSDFETESMTKILVLAWSPDQYYEDALKIFKPVKDNIKTGSSGGGWINPNSSRIAQQIPGLNPALDPISSKDVIGY